MKKFIKAVVFGAIFIVCLFAINTGCKKKAECSGAIPLCGNNTFTACCTETDCYYLVNGGDQTNCNGTDCYTAAAIIYDKYCATGAAEFTKQQALDTVERLLQAIK